MNNRHDSAYYSNVSLKLLFSYTLNKSSGLFLKFYLKPSTSYILPIANLSMKLYSSTIFTYVCNLYPELQISLPVCVTHLTRYTGRTHVLKVDFSKKKLLNFKSNMVVRLNQHIFLKINFKCVCAAHMVTVIFSSAYIRKPIPNTTVIVLFTFKIESQALFE